MHIAIWKDFPTNAYLLKSGGPPQLQEKPRTSKSMREFSWPFDGEKLTSGPRESSFGALDKVEYDKEQEDARSYSLRRGASRRMRTRNEGMARGQKSTVVYIPVARRGQADIHGVQSYQTKYRSICSSQYMS